jgi:hypothetical protein
MKYYFISYGAKCGQTFTIWNEVIAGSPMKFIMDMEEAEKQGGNIYRDFVVINTCEITEEEYIEYLDQF